jgi:GNAT superfamily N-acetyltransferase
LIDCVEGGDSVGFMAPLAREKADAFWWGVTEGIVAGERILLVAEDRASGEIFGTVQVVLGQPENQPHRADVAKKLVHRRARRRGFGAALMRAVEDTARAASKTLLVLDTASSDAERLYERLGWTRVGQMPGYASCPTGALATPRSSTNPSRRPERAGGGMDDHPERDHDRPQRASPGSGALRRVTKETPFRVSVFLSAWVNLYVPDIAATFPALCLRRQQGAEIVNIS